MLFYCSLNCSVLDILEYIRQYFLDNIACINWYKRCKGLLYLLLLLRFLIFIPSIILIRTFVFVNFVLCSLFFFRNFPNILLSVWELWISKNHNIYTSHGHEITKNLHAPFTWKVEVHFVTSNTEWLNIVHLSKNVVFTEGKEKATIYQKRWTRFWSLWHHNNYLYPAQLIVFLMDNSFCFNDQSQQISFSNFCEV